MRFASIVMRTRWNESLICLISERREGLRGGMHTKKVLEE
jgi:hypothetical protein